jgi:hypothetical protein
MSVSVVEERPDAMTIVLPVDLSGLGWDAVWAMTGRRPDPMPPASGAA